MPKRDAAPIGAPCWVDLLTSDPDEERSVLRRAVRLDGRRSRSRLRRLHQLPQGRRPGRRLHEERRTVRDARRLVRVPGDRRRRAATVDAAVAHGGGVIVPAMDVMELGRMAVVDRRGSTPRSASGSPGCTRASASSASPARRTGSSCTPATTTRRCSFYRDVFKWDDAASRATLPSSATRRSAKATSTLAGIMDASAFLPEGVPGALVGLLRRRRRRCRARQIVELGGSIVQARGRHAVRAPGAAADSTGARSSSSPADVATVTVAGRNPVPCR